MQIASKLEKNLQKLSLVSLGLVKGSTGSLQNGQVVKTNVGWPVKQDVSTAPHKVGKSTQMSCAPGRRCRNLSGSAQWRRSATSNGLQPNGAR